MSPALSVVIPARNAAAQLEACLASLARSELRDFEVVVVDDASSDGTADVARAAGARLLRLERQGGPAAARNRGAEVVTGTHLLFVDADVCVHAGTLAQVAAAFRADPDLAALFGSYDLRPAEPNLLSQYKNLFHHFVHQAAPRRAATFWSGCGAIRRSVFRELRGFDPAYVRPCVEDIELGARLCRAGHRVELHPEIQATHLKRWTLAGLLRSDLWDRGVPWTELALREGRLPRQLNLAPSQRLAALLACGLVALLGLAAWRAPAWALAPGLLIAVVLALDAWSLRARRLPRSGLALLGAAEVVLAGLAFWSFGAWALPGLALLLALAVINARFYAFFARERHPLFLAAVLPLHLLYYVCCCAALAVGLARHSWRTLLRGRPAEKAAAGASWP